MPRPREFDPDAAVVAAMETFWRQGFDGASMTDLTTATGVGRQSLYLAFGDKRALYLAALDRYREVFQAPLLEVLRAGGSGGREGAGGWHVRAVLRAAMVSLVDGSCGDVADGCLLVNAATERAPHDEEVRRRVAAAFQALEDAVTEALSTAVDDGAVSLVLDPRAFARSLTTTIQGLRVVAAVNPDRRALLEIIDTALAPLR